MSISEKFVNAVTIILIVAMIILLCWAVCRINDAIDHIDAAVMVCADRSVQPETDKELGLVTYEYKPLPVDYENMGTTAIADSDAILLAKLMWGEYNNPADYGQSAAVCWCVLNRLDEGTFGDTIKEVVTAPGQFHGYRRSNPVDADLYKIACEVLLRYELEKLGAKDAGRVLPKEYLYFSGNGIVNIYRTAYTGGSRLIP